jgi:pyruvate/2-oxoglutarate dehydrogenase complex dihydrolipoamide acyltransferase (E2) component
MGTSDSTAPDAAIEVTISHSGLSEDVVVVEWFVGDGHSVEAGDPLVLIESEKTEIEIEAPASGRLEIEVPASDLEVAVGSTIGKIWPIV